METSRRGFRLLGPLYGLLVCSALLGCPRTEEPESREPTVDEIIESIDLEALAREAAAELPPIGWYCFTSRRSKASAGTEHCVFGSFVCENERKAKEAEDSVALTTSCVMPEQFYVIRGSCEGEPDRQCYVHMTMTEDQCRADLPRIVKEHPGAASACTLASQPKPQATPPQSSGS